ncbi:diaminopimelate epimerase [Bdellovibrio svalbardensis]|uniref:Diaminopimelate epimerase n=1 Tax=Bdellovibrio svalbardensis TaxID=2972972 RepID=A0ABT6DIE3_9BACT|nr:diaminopimelate epimerase [Bdellovibrio svalbardensis]MDG0814878.1 diaminopimelate epimerase [Bdellovibrio svalbardensis]
MSSFLPVRITKMSGAGNTFALIDARDSSVWKNVEKDLHISRPEFAKKVCDTVLGVATDGLLLIETGSDGFDFNWDFYNNDGSTAEMCGNAARCAARYCQENLANELKSIRFKTGAGLVTAEILGDGRVRVRMPEAKYVRESIELKTQSSSTETFALVNTGVPHLVQKIHTMEDVENLKEMARECRSHVDLKPAGANVTFYTIENSKKIQAVTFERGVEDYTLACGTGAVAAALVHSKESKEKSIEVQMPGGIMMIQFVEGDTHPLMTGEAVFVGDFLYNLEVVR